MLQDSATDSEEIIYPIRAPSSCSAPPDLLMSTGQDQTDCVGALHSLAATTTNCHNSPVHSCGGGVVDSQQQQQQHYQVHRRMRQKLMEQHQQRVSRAVKENLKGMNEAGEVATGDLVRLEVSFYFLQSLQWFSVVILFC